MQVTDFCDCRIYTAVADAAVTRQDRADDLAHLAQGAAPALNPLNV